MDQELRLKPTLVEPLMVLRKDIYKLAFTFITPLGTQDDACIAGKLVDAM